MSTQIRKAQATDADNLAELIRSLVTVKWIAAVPATEARNLISRHLALCLRDDSHSVYLAHASDGTLLGFCCVHWLPYLIFRGPEGFVLELFVAGHMRGQRVGTLLLEAAKAEALERGCTRLMLINLRDRESYQRAFYQQRGWEEREAAANFVLRLPTP
jgi:GNAT superfamily N-acetyltransferase